MLTTISAPPGTGKSLKCVQIIEESLRKNPNRLIFTNIIGLNIPGVLPILSSANKPFDWRDLPDGSLVVYDEAHEHPAFAKTDLLNNYQLPSYINDLYDNEVSKVLDYANLPKPLKIQLLNKHGHVYTELPIELKVKESEQIISKIRNLQKLHLSKAKDDILDIGRGLTMHRHWGFDIILVTQKPDLLNAFVKAACSEHLILRRLFKMELAVIYTFTEIQDHFGNATRKNAISWSIWFFPKHLYKYYISAEQHTAKASFPWWMKFGGAAFAGLVCLSIYKTTDGSFGLFKNDNAENAQQVAPVQPTQQTTASANPNQPKQQIQDLSNICRQAVNVETPECKKWFDELSKNGGSLGYVQTFAYDGNKPFDVEYTPTDLEPKDFPRFKNAIVYNGKCTAYSQQGTIMHKVSTKDCFRLANGDRPFDYFYEGEQTSNRSNYSISTPVIPASQHQETAQTINPNPQIIEQPFSLDAKPPKAITGAHTL
ncbi:zonular occludens toxin domain-containing protein [Acinetobacter johnsonii]|uniref:zonular occludens toxin domain-containing protein n=1 Tax=Acinetobacter johnsonii TaxID=40214 RepID=UPI002FD95152|nr:zonular occludens toxin domain-containing protein [Acinetobacter johnsonii]WQN48807.1 zonular occludens toxin domain-containing protein [Acinetobacter johnsonii]WQN48819.1 zonular occludens toxin domain-containing protein [Acinetobacter johnsonii]